MFVAVMSHNCHKHNLFFRLEKSNKIKSYSLNRAEWIIWGYLFIKYTSSSCTVWILWFISKPLKVNNRPLVSQTLNKSWVRTWIIFNERNILIERMSLQESAEEENVSNHPDIIPTKKTITSNVGLSRSTSMVSIDSGLGPSRSTSFI